MSEHFSSYLNIAEGDAKGISLAVKKTVNDLFPKHIKTFSFRENLTGLLLGNVQSGKTSHVLGIISAAADEGFPLFIYLTTDNVYLQEQTFSRSVNSLDTFTVCGESDEVRFLATKMRKPLLIVLKKNSRVLQRWKDNLAASKFCEGRAIFVIDDEADAASLNTKINDPDQSAINRHLEDIKKLGNSSIYLQVTATPQSVLLQTSISGWKPTFIYYFPPGEKYLGGDYFYKEPYEPSIKITPETELEDLRDLQAPISVNLSLALYSFLITCSHLAIKENVNVCNFLIHPSVKTADHQSVVEKIGQLLNEMIIALSEGDVLKNVLFDTWTDLSKTKLDIIDFNSAYMFIKNDLLESGKLKINLMNSIGSFDIDTRKGFNITVGGNSLGRGVTFSRLQTVYYCRSAKIPQADTFWQHCRMFGYDRDKDLMRIYIPASLLKMFVQLNNSNRALIEQVVENDPNKITLLYPPNIKPTRDNVIDKDLIDIIVGGVNYFQNSPNEDNANKMDELLKDYDASVKHEITFNQLINLLEHLESKDNDDWSHLAFSNCISALASNIKADYKKAILIVRRDRNISKNTGTLLSPDDRKLGDVITDFPVLTLYRVTGEVKKGWSGKPFWIPNIKLPIGKNFYRIDK